MLGAFGAARGRILIAGSAFDLLQTADVRQRVMGAIGILLASFVPVATAVHPASDFHDVALWIV